MVLKVSMAAVFVLQVVSLLESATLPMVILLLLRKSQSVRFCSTFYDNFETTTLAHNKSSAWISQK